MKNSRREGEGFLDDESTELQPPADSQDRSTKNRQDRERVLEQSEQLALKMFHEMLQEDKKPVGNDNEEQESLIDQSTNSIHSNNDLDDDELSSKASPKPPKLSTALQWLLTSRIFPTVLSQWILKRASQIMSSTEAQGFVQTFEMSFGNSKGDFEGADDNIGYGLLGALGFYLLRALGPDGYNPETGILTCADGTSEKFGFKEITWSSFLLKLFALPSRPMTLDRVGRPQYSFLQLLYSLAGTSWNPVKETITGDLLEFVTDQSGNPIRETGTGRQRTKVKKSNASFYQRRWTEKKGFLFALAVVRVPLFVVFNLVTWPFRFVRTLLKIVTEILLPLISYGMIKLAEAFEGLSQRVAESALKSGLSLHLVWQIPVYLIMLCCTLVVAIAQYLMSLMCRIGLAFSSPLTSALLAYNSGVLILGSEYSTSLFSRFIGGLGFVLSMALSAAVWAITWPLAFGALVTAVPALLTPITALSQSPFIANVLAWLTQLPFVVSVSTAFGTAFGVVGGALTATFGAAIAYLGAFVGVTIPQVVVAFSLIISAIVMPALTLVTWGVETLSTAIMQWVEQRPFHTLMMKLKFWDRTEEGAEKGQIAEGVKYVAPLFVHQAVPGGDYVVELIACHLVAEKQENDEKVRKQVEILKVQTGNWRQCEKVFNNARANIEHSNQRSRFANDEERGATYYDPVEFKGVERGAKAISAQ